MQFLPMMWRAKVIVNGVNKKPGEEKTPGIAEGSAAPIY